MNLPARPEPRLLTAQDLLDLRRKAEASPRRRMNLNLHGGDAALLHRFVISMCRDSYIRPHRHLQAHKLEMATVLEGCLDWVFLDAQGRLLQRQRLSADGPVRAIEVPPGAIHSVVGVSAHASFLEVKQGPYDAAQDKDFLPSSPAEFAADVPAYLEWLRSAAVGAHWSPA